MMIELSAEEAGVVYDGLIYELNEAKRRKMVNLESASDERAKMACGLMARIVDAVDREVASSRKRHADDMTLLASGAHFDHGMTLPSGRMASAGECCCVKCLNSRADPREGK